MAEVDRMELEKLIDGVLSSSGEDLVDFNFRREPAGWVLRVYIDHVDPAAPPVTVDDCARASHGLSAALDAADLIDQAYSLEVSSPGLDRPLRTAEHFRRFAGRHAKIRLGHGVPAPAGAPPRRNFTGRIAGVDAGDVLLTMAEDGETVRLPLADLVKANLVPEL